MLVYVIFCSVWAAVNASKCITNEMRSSRCPSIRAKAADLGLSAAGISRMQWACMTFRPNYSKLTSSCVDANMLTDAIMRALLSTGVHMPATQVQVGTVRRLISGEGVGQRLSRALGLKATIRRDCSCSSNCHWCCTFYGGIFSAAYCFRLVCGGGGRC